MNTESQGKVLAQSIRRHVNAFTSNTSPNLRDLELVNSILALSRDILSFVKDYPQIASSLAATSSSGEEHVASQCLKTTIFTGLIGQLNQFNDHYNQHLIAASLSAFYCECANLSRQEDVRSISHHTVRFIKLVEQKGFRIWALALKSSSALHMTSPLALFHKRVMNKEQAVTIWSITLGKTSGSTFFPTLFNCLKLSPPTLCSLLQPLFNFPGGYPPGTTISYNEKQYTVGMIGEEAIFVEDDSGKVHSIDRLVLKGMPDAVDYADWEFEELDSNENIPRQSKHWPIPRAYSVTAPPKSLTSILTMLQNPDVDIKQLTEAIEKEPSFSDFLTASASKDNRLKLPVSDIKQGVLTYGVERIGDMLVQQALSQRLGQRFYPLLTESKVFANLCATIASEIAARVSNITPQKAALITTFATAPLFTLPSLKVVSKFSRTEKKYYSVQTLVSEQSNVDFSAYSTQLARAWQQPKESLLTLNKLTSATNSLPLSIRHYHATTNFSIYLARKWLYGCPSRCEKTQTQIFQSKEVLSLEPSFENKLKSNVSALVFCPI